MDLTFSVLLNSTPDITRMYSALDWTVILLCLTGGIVGYLSTEEGSNWERYAIILGVFSVGYLLAIPLFGFTSNSNLYAGSLTFVDIKRSFAIGYVIEAPFLLYSDPEFRLAVGKSVFILIVGMPISFTLVGTLGIEYIDKVMVGVFILFGVHFAETLIALVGPTQSDQDS